MNVNTRRCVELMLLALLFVVLIFAPITPLERANYMLGIGWFYAMYMFFVS